MRIDGQWLWCDDGVMRPVISDEVLADNGSWEQSEFLVDTGADRTVFSAVTLAKLGLQPLPMQDGISGVDGMAASVIVATQIQLTREDAGKVVFRGQDAASHRAIGQRTDFKSSRQIAGRFQRPFPG